MSEQLEAREALFPDGVEQSDITGFFYFSLGIGIVRLAVHEVICFGVVLGVRVLPRVVRDQKYGMEYQPYTVVDELRGGESPMATFVGEDPPSRQSRPLEEGVGLPA